MSQICISCAPIVESRDREVCDVIKRLRYPNTRMNFLYCTVPLSNAYRNHSEPMSDAQMVCSLSHDLNEEGRASENVHSNEITRRGSRLCLSSPSPLYLSVCPEPHSAALDSAQFKLPRPPYGAHTESRRIARLHLSTRRSFGVIIVALPLQRRDKKAVGRFLEPAP